MSERQRIIDAISGRSGQIRIDCTCQGSQKKTLCIDADNGPYVCHRCGIKGNVKKDPDKKPFHDNVKRDPYKKPFAEYVWDHSLPRKTHPYLELKGIKPHGARINSYKGKENLIVPYYIDGQITTAQTIDNTGDEKKFLPKDLGCKAKGASHIIEGETDEVFVCEGFATAASIQESTGKTSVSVGMKSNFEPSFEQIKHKFNGAKITFCADNDENGGGLGYAARAAKYFGGRLVMPEMVGKDFNDIYVESGPDAVLELLNHHLDIDVSIENTSKKDITPDAMSNDQMNNAIDDIFKWITDTATNKQDILDGWVDKLVKIVVLNPLARVRVDSIIKAVGDKTGELFPLLSKVFEDHLSKEIEAKMKAGSTIPVESMTLYELMKLNPQVDPLVVGLINNGEGVIIHAPGGLGKSMLALNIAIEMALNGPDLLFDKFKITRRITSMFIQTENSGATVNARVRKMVGGDPDRIESLKYISMPVIHKDVLAKGCPFSDESFQAWLVAVIEKAGKAMGQPVDVLWIDPLISFSAGDENDSAKMRQELDALSEVSRECGVTPIVIHHDNRAGDYRGASAIYDWCRGMISMKAEFIGSDRITDIQGDEVTHRTASVPCIRIIHEKANNMGKFMPFLVRMDQSLNFQPIDEAMSPEQMEQGKLIQQALTDLGEAGTQNELIKTYVALSGTSAATARRHMKTATDNNFISKISINRNGQQTYEYSISN